ncbi:F-box family protein isoform 1 [Hibiscus syriacus]|uniref:F-box family protein isoform 1 n=1 Tax=Hibiscus syriacus TaxID=106335 RepID=A0A6A2WLY0_HIBSY|nr:F-box family protein isoform 1 [Hibiscus syriacus]
MEEKKGQRSLVPAHAFYTFDPPYYLDCECVLLCAKSGLYSLDAVWSCANLEGPLSIIARRIAVEFNTREANIANSYWHMYPEPKKATRHGMLINEVAGARSVVGDLDGIISNVTHYYCWRGQTMNFSSISYDNMGFSLKSEAIELGFNFQNLNQMTPQTPNDTFYMSAPTSPRRISMEVGVMPLKPLPRLQYHKQSSILSSPRSPTGGLRLSFQRRSLWNDDFDPFMAALKNVKEEEAGESQAKNHRRARSMSPFREITTPKETNNMLVSNQQQINQMGLILPTKQSDQNSNKMMEKNEPAKPKGVAFVNVGNEDSTMEGGESGKQTKGQKVKNLLFRSGSMRPMSNENKGTCHGNGTETRPKLKRKFSLKAMGITPHREEKNESEVILMTLVRYRPKLLLCMGYGAKYGK